MLKLTSPCLNIFLYPQISNVSMLPADKEFDLIMTRLVPDSAGRERELSRRVIWTRCLGSGCRPAIWRTSRWSMKGTRRPGKANFQPFSTMQGPRDKRGADWHSEEEGWIHLFGSEEVGDYLPNLATPPPTRGLRGTDTTRDREGQGGTKWT